MLHFREGQMLVTLEMSQCILSYLFSVVVFHSKSEEQLPSYLLGKPSEERLTSTGIKIQGKEIKHLHLEAVSSLPLTPPPLPPNPPPPRD